MRKGWGRMAIHMLLLPDKRLLIMNRSRTNPETAFIPALISSSSLSNPYLYDLFTEVEMPPCDQVASSSWTANSEIAESFVTSDDGEQSPHPYIRSSDKKVHVKLLWVGGTSSFQGRFDLAEFGVR